MANFEMKDIF